MTEPNLHFVIPTYRLRDVGETVEAYDEMTLVALHLATAACGSLILALALTESRLDADAAFDAAQLDETFEIEQWGEDPEQMRRRAGLREDIAIAARLVELLRG